jgi:neutral ceramidase
MPLYAGLAEANITPPHGVWMCGYAFRPSGCTAVHDELFARALVLNDGVATVAIVAMDLIGLDFDLVEEVRRNVAERTSLPGYAILLNATHTHGGPNVRAFNTMGDRDPAYIDVLTRKIVGIIVQAADRLQPASLKYGQAPVQIGVNRRQYPNDKGVTVIGRNPSGPVDQRVQSVVVWDSRQRPTALLFSHACHPTTMGGENLEITADFPGVACGTVREATGGVVMPFFLQACCGNINPEPRGTYECVFRHGSAVGEAALEALDSAVTLSHSPIEAAETSIDLPLIPPPSRESINENLELWAGKVREFKHAARPGHLLHAEGLYNYFKLEEALASNDPISLSRPFAIQRLMLGELQFLGMPAEMFVQYQLDFERQASGPVLSLGYTNGVHGYVPVAADYPYGGYEVDGAHRYYGTLMYTADCEPLIRDEVYRLLGVREPDRTPYRIKS